MQKGINKKLIIGTANFGSNYGRFNTKDFILEDEAKEILELGSRYECNILDTANDYQNSEKIIGNSGVKNLQIITKLGFSNPDLTIEEDLLEKILKQSLDRLKASKLYCLLFRKPIILTKEKFYPLWKEAENLKKKKIINKIGITIYDPDELDIILEKILPDVVQLPFNIFDNRFTRSGWLDKLHSSNVEIHARSVFLQGLLLQNTNNLKGYLNKYNYIWRKYKKWIRDENLNPLDICMSYVNSQKKISKIVIGINSPKQLEEILNFKQTSMELPEWMMKIKNDMIKPNKWNS
ncbi:MAG: aldo/keto reductase [Rickettsiales bacterium]|nr:aldo/keto reductase [Rickettsiales bacterium]